MSCEYLKRLSRPGQSAYLCQRTECQACPAVRGTFEEMLLKIRALADIQQLYVDVMPDSITVGVIRSAKTGAGGATETIEMAGNSGTVAAGLLLNKLNG